MFCAKKDFLNFRNYLPLEKGRPLIWINLNPLYLRILWFFTSLVEIGPVVLEKMIFKIHNFVFISPTKRVGPSFKQTWIPFTQGCFVPKMIF